MHQALHVVGIGVGVAAGDVVFFAYPENGVDSCRHVRVVVLSRVSHLLAEVSLADQNDADSRYLFKYRREVVDGEEVLALDDD